MNVWLKSLVLKSDFSSGILKILGFEETNYAETS